MLTRPSCGYCMNRESNLRAKGSATIFSLIQMAFENDLEPYRDLTWLLKDANTADLSQSEAVQKLLHGMHRMNAR